MAKARILKALYSHTMVDVIAAAADVPLAETVKILEELARAGEVERHSVNTWSRV